MIENEICCYMNGFLKWNINNKASYFVGNKEFFGKICILNLRNKRKTIFAREIIRYCDIEQILRISVRFSCRMIAATRVILTLRLSYRTASPEICIVTCLYLELKPK